MRDLLAAELRRAVLGDVEVAGSYDRRAFRIDLSFEESEVQLITADDQRKVERTLRESPRAAQVLMTYEHELTHWFQQIGTAFGFYELDAEAAASRQIGEFISNYRKLMPGSRLPRPIWTWVESRWEMRRAAYRKHIRSGGSLQSYQASIHVDPWSSALGCFQLQRIIELCEGTAQTSELFAEFLFRHGWRAFLIDRRSNYLDVSMLEAWSALEEDAFSRYRAAAPTIPGYGTFGAHQIMEGQANAVELLKIKVLGRQLGLRIDSSSYVSETELPDYRVAFDHYRKHAATQASSSTDVLLTFLAVCDLALASPLHPTFASTSQKVGWRDVHPGWRFLRLCETLETTGTMKCDSISLNTGKYLDFVENVTSSCAWPTPDQLARAFLSLGDEVRMASLQGTLFSLACMVRLEAPTAFVLYLHDDADRAQKLVDNLPIPPVYFGADSLRLASRPGMPEDEELLLTRGMLYQSDINRLSEFLARHGGEWADLGNLATHSDAASMLRSAWNVDTSDFRLIVHG